MTHPLTRPSDWELCIVVRSSPDWGSLTREQFEAQAREFCRRVNRPVEQTVETARLWDQTFRTTFCETRQAMKAIAQELLARMRVNEIVHGPPPEIRKETLYLVTDDDDWCSPDLPDALADVPSEGYDGATWGSAVLGPIRGGVDEPVLEEPQAIKWRSLTVACHSNNYALTPEYFARPGAKWDRVFSHGHADETFRKLRVFNIERYLSVKNTNPASTVFLENGLRKDFSRARLRQLVEQYNTRLETCVDATDPRLSWSQPGIEAVRKFFRELSNAAR